MADVVKYLAQEIVNSDYLLSQLDVDGKINMVRISMGLPIKPRNGNNFRGDAPMVFDGISSKEIVHSPSEISELQLEVADKETNRFNFSNPFNSQVQYRTLFIKIHYVKYSISCRELDMLFSRFGILENTEILGLENEFHSKICFQNKESALEAFNSFNGRNIYDGCCRMELFLMSNLGRELTEFKILESSSFSNHGERGISKETESSCDGSVNEFSLKMSEIADSRQATGEKDLLRSQSKDQCPTFSKESSDEIRFVGDEDLPRCESVDEIRIQVQESVPSMVVQVGKELVLDAYNLFDEMPMGDNSEKLQENCNLDLNKEFASLNIPLRSFDSDMQETQSNNDTEVFDDLKIDGDSSKVISDHVEAIAYDVSYGEKDVIAGELGDSSKIRVCDFKGKIFEFGAISTAHHVFAEMPNRGFNGIDYSIQLSNAHLLMGNWNLDPRDFIDLRLAKKASLVFQGILLREVVVAKGNKTNVVFDPRIAYYDRNSKLFELFVDFDIEVRREFDGLNVVFNPGGINCPWLQVMCGQKWELLELMFFVKWCKIIASSYEYGVMGIPMGNCVEFIAILWPYDRGKVQPKKGNGVGSNFSIEDELVLAIYDIFLAWIAIGLTMITSGLNVSMKVEVFKPRLQWDPGGLTNELCLIMHGKRAY